LGVVIEENVSNEVFDGSMHVWSILINNGANQRSNMELKHNNSITNN